MSASEAQVIAERATHYIDEMLLQLLSLKHSDSNSVCLGTLININMPIQIQLVITNDPDCFLDE